MTFPLYPLFQGEEAAEEETPAQATPAEKPKIGGVTQGKYIPPSMRDGGSKKGESMMSSRGRGKIWEILRMCLVYKFCILAWIEQIFLDLLL